MSNSLESENIYNARMASNKAIAEGDLAGVARYWMEDIVVISGEGGKYVGKKSLELVWKEMLTQDTPLFERLPEEIRVGESGQLAWESGIWSYLDGSLGGNYAAMWRKINGKWLTRSELFVSLD